MCLGRWPCRKKNAGEAPVGTRISEAQPERRTNVVTAPAPPQIELQTVDASSATPPGGGGTAFNGTHLSTASTLPPPTLPASPSFLIPTPSPSLALGPRSPALIEQPFGLKVLAPGDDPILDLICVHGLNGHREDTWTADNNTLWLQDLLAPLVPRVRILSYGYDGRTYGSSLSCQTLHDRAVGLITDLSQQRKAANITERPIIFIAHSIGGIILKDALMYSTATSVRNLGYYKGIKISTYGILFFGTPHQGMENLPGPASNNLTWGQILVDVVASINTSATIFRDLEENSDLLQRQLAEYRNISSDFVTKFFYETYPAPGGKLLVPRASAVVPGAPDTETFAIYSNHHGMVKYKDAGDDGFQKASRCIIDMLKDAPEAIKGNWERWKLTKDLERGNIIAISDRERKDFLSWLSTLEPEKDLERLYSKRHASTGSWLIESEKYLNWKRANESCLLWCRGHAGVGKSVLASIVVKDIISEHPPDDKTAVAYFFFSFQEDVTQTVANVLAALLKQLCRNKTDLPSSLVSLYKKCTRNDQRPTLSELRKHMAETICSFTNIFLVMDAMDECKEEYRQDLLPYIRVLLQCSLGQLKIFVTSRFQPDVELESRRIRLDTINIDTRAVDTDIAAYVGHVLSTKPHKYGFLDKDLAEKVKSALVNQANGMFLWAQCQLDYIYQQPSEAAVHAALKEIPRDMKATYERMMENILKQARAQVTVAKRALTWVVSAGRPLSPDELATAIAIEPTSTSSWRCRKTYEVQVAIDVCCGLLIIEGGRVRPIHPTVQTFLTTESSHIPTGVGAHRKLAISSIRYMMCQEFSRVESMHCDKDSREDGLDPMLYIWNFWDHHVRRSDLPLPDDLKTLLQTFFHSEYRHGAYAVRGRKNQGHVTVMTLCATVDLLQVYRLFNDLSTSITTSEEYKEAIDNAASAGSLTALGELLDLRGERDKGDLDMLYLSAQSGQENIVRYMLGRGLAPDDARGEKGTALQAASYEGHQNAVEVLLASSVNVNIQYGQYNTALQAASYRGHQDVVKALLDSDADVNIKGGEYYTALQAASSTGGRCNLTLVSGSLECDTSTHLEIVSMLLEWNSDVNLSGGKYGTALQAAAHRGHNKIVEALLKRNADVNITGTRFGTALQAAAAYVGGRHDSTKNDTVDILIKKGAKINAPGGIFGTALHAAAYACYEAITGTLLTSGADVNLVAGVYGTALQAAAAPRYFQILGEEHRPSRIRIIKALIAKGAKVNFQGGKYGSALHAAAYAGYKTVVELLIENGADVNTHDETLGTPVQAAVRGRYMATVNEGNRHPMGDGEDDYFISHNADSPSGASHIGAHPRHICPWEEIVIILLENGAKVNTLGDEYLGEVREHSSGRHTPPARRLIEGSVRKGLEERA